MKKIAVLLVLIMVGCKGGTKNEPIIEVVLEDTKAVSTIEEEVYHLVETQNPEDFEKLEIDIEYFKNKVFGVGPSMEVNKCEIVAECDCCMADLVTFDNDFYYISDCMGDKAYMKGTFEVDEGRLLLIFEENYLSEYFSEDSEDDTSELKIEKVEDIDITKVSLLQCNNKRLLSLQYDDSVEFAMQTETDNIDYIENLKKENTNLWLTFVNL